MNVPVVVVGRKSDLLTSAKKKIIDLPIFQNFRQIENFLQCSALKVDEVLDVFCFAQQLVLHPTAPLIDVRK